jgi:uncharacterized protein (DUF362 family)
MEEDRMALVAVVKTEDRAAGVDRALALLDVQSLGGRDVFLKPNFNSDDPFPGSTHNDTLRALMNALWNLDADRITVGDRSGMGETRRVMERKGIFAMADELGFDTLVFDEMDADEWKLHDVIGSHWERGFPVARPVLDADVVVQTCCLKTHRYGGHFTLSLKNSVGLIAKEVPGEGYNYMSELHGSPYQRLMIAEVNAGYDADLVVMDGLEAFVEGGPARGKRVRPGVMVASFDRVALDAVGVAILRYYGTTAAVERGPIFEQEQIARAVDLDLGVDAAESIELVTDDDASASFAFEIRSILTK